MASYPVPKRVLKSEPLHRKRRERGTALVEFVLATGILIVPLFFGVITIGLSLVLANQVTEVCRDTGHMYAYGVDFSNSSSQTLVTSQLAQGLGITNTGGNGVIYLSTITYVDGNACIASGYLANSGSCPNINSYVVVKRIVIGNSAIQSPTYGPSIPASIIQSNGQIKSSDYLTNSAVQVNSFSNVITLNAGSFAYVCEMFMNPPTGGLWNLFGSNIVTALSVF